jgi:FAD/FMN-containing dehydrogenase
LKREAMRKIKSPVELEMMNGLKRMLDPKGILSPGRVLPD